MEKEKSKYIFTLDDGSQISVGDENAENPYVFVESDTNLPAIDYPITAVARLAKMACKGSKDYSYFAKELGISEEKVREWVKEGLDGKKQWRGRVPVRYADCASPTNRHEVRMVALHVNPYDGGVVWMPDWTQGDLLYRRVVTSFSKNDKRVEYWKNNYEQNLPFNKGIADLRGSWRGRPAIIVGSSPSLGKQVETIKRAARTKNAKIIGANRVFRTLPPEIFDYFVLLDYACRRDWFEGYDCNKTELLQFIFASSMVRDYWRDDRIRWWVGNIIQPNLEMEEKHGDLGFMVTGGSVSTAMIWFAFYWLEANPIITCGLDHSYPGLMEYPGEPMSYKPEKLSRIGMRYTNEEGTGRLVPTSQMLVNQRIANDMAAIWIRKAGRRIINCTEGGILRNPDRMPLADAVHRFLVRGEDPNDDENFQDILREERSMLSGSHKQKVAV